ncbi:hypothetical protein AKJ09_09396 [Labilithrix luteola]|uniref:Uncharacterized protein n=1 Tax=Labilithrix luteola TaxID=1391654 RepID=A0A0K1QAI4_9BACT|nr:hypothetical protein AKJ09_09396 [Labilithrix luteola]
MRRHLVALWLFFELAASVPCVHRQHLRRRAKAGQVRSPFATCGRPGISPDSGRLKRRLWRQARALAIRLESSLLRRPLAWTVDFGAHDGRGPRNPRSFAQVCRELRLTVQSAQLSCAVGAVVRSADKLARCPGSRRPSSRGVRRGTRAAEDPRSGSARGRLGGDRDLDEARPPVALRPYGATGLVRRRHPRGCELPAPEAKREVRP